MFVRCAGARLLNHDQHDCLPFVIRMTNACIHFLVPRLVENQFTMALGLAGAPYCDAHSRRLSFARDKLGEVDRSSYISCCISSDEVTEGPPDVWRRREIRLLIKRLSTPSSSEVDITPRLRNMVTASGTYVKAFGDGTPSSS